MEILEKIVAHKKIEVAKQKEQISIKALEKYPQFEWATTSLSAALQKPNASGIIAEFKRRSPSKGLINGKAVVQKVAEGYEKAGVTGMSILTDNHFFGGSNEDLMEARKAVELPLLRKDFIIDEYQIIEAKAIGADVILLIAACLTKQRLKELAQFARSLGLDVLMEIHAKKELALFNDAVTIIGVNNRNLKTFEVSVETSLNMLSELPTNIPRISESGISIPSNVAMLKRAGYQGFLIGESFMKTKQPAEKCKSFIQEVARVYYY